MDAPLQRLLEVEARARALVDDASPDRQRIIKDALAAAREVENALWRLLAASRKQQKRVNALKYNIIPRYRATVQHIRAALEEDERNTLFQIKVLRARKPA